MSGESLVGRMGLRVPVVAAPLGGGPSTPELVAAVGEAGAFGFLAAGYLSGDRMAGQVAQARALTGRPFGVNVFVPGSPVVDRAAIEAYADLLRPWAERLGVALGEPRWDDDAYDAKLAVLLADPVPVVSFTFGCPSAEVVSRLHDVGSAVLVTVTSAREAVVAVEAGADGLVAQGAEAGGHNAAFADDAAVAPGSRALGLLPLLRQVLAAVDVR